jgi:3-methyl-2-oxobutanoate hydroxymethyltransferase
MSAAPEPVPVNVRQLQRMAAAGDRIVALTAYDTATARLVEAAGVDLVLVGDSLGMTILGHRTTVPVTLSDILHHTAAVVRGVKRAMVVADMPFMTYQVSPEQALSNAARCLQEAGADAVKLEGGSGMAPTIARLVQAGVPVMAHIGLMPQSVLTEGGYRVRGRGESEAAALLADAEAVQQAGAFALVLECVTATVAERITAALQIPTIGIGAGAGCSGQIQVVHDLLGLSGEKVPRHAKTYVNLAQQIRAAVETYAAEVRHGQFPGAEHSFD